MSTYWHVHVEVLGFRGPLPDALTVRESTGGDTPDPKSSEIHLQWPGPGEVEPVVQVVPGDDLFGLVRVGGPFTQVARGPGPHDASPVTACVDGVVRSTLL